MNVCPNCKEGFEPSCETHVYCSKRCGKAAQKRRTSERKAKHGAYHCPICGKYGIRRVNAGKKIVTCGEKACVAMHKKRYKAATNKRYRLEGRKWPSAKTTCKCGQYKGQASKQYTGKGCARHHQHLTCLGIQNQNWCPTLSGT